MKRRILSVLMALALCVELLPGTAAAAGTDGLGSEVEYRIDGGGWSNASLMDAIYAGYGASSTTEIRLLRDIDLTSENWGNAPGLGICPSWTIDGEGHKITLKCMSQVFEVGTSSYQATLTLQNITVDGGAVWSGNDPASRVNTGASWPVSYHLAVVDVNSTLILDRAILQNSDFTGNNSFGAAVRVLSGKLIMREGSAIRNNSAKGTGTGVYVDAGAEFQMEGGEISGNYVGSGGGGVGVVSGGKFTMTGGKLSENYAANNGGGIWSQGAFEMSGGTIIGNQSTLGGGGLSVFSGTAKLTGGQISGNTITGSMGGGVLVYNGSLTVGGSPVIANNTKMNEETNNIYLNSGKTIAVEGSLTQGAQIGVTVPASAAPQEGTPAPITGSAADKQYFSSDNLAYVVENNQSSGIVQLVLRTPSTVIFDAGEDITAPEPQKTTERGQLAALPEVTREGYTLDGWYTAETGGTKISTNTVFDSDTTVYARWLKNYIVTFMIGDTEMSSEMVASGRTASKPADPTREGYVFGGWYTDEVCTSAYDFSTFVTEDLILYAKWTANTPPPSPGGDIPYYPAIPSTPSTPSNPTTPSQPGTTAPSQPVTTETTTQGGASTAETTAVPTANTQDGTASAAVDASMGDEIVRQAVDNNSETVVIAPQVTGDVAKTEVSIPAATVGQIGSQTSASLTVSTPVAEVSIPNGGLGSLASAGGTVTVAAEKAGNTVELSVTAGGKAVTSVPGGLTLTVPASNTTPGTVAVLLREDGTREVVRKSVAAGGGVTVPLDGSAKLEIVDNSKQFADVPAGSWAADAVAFASAHELFGGASPDRFDPDKPMSRGMLAVVLHNLEGNPFQAVTNEFADVEGGAWYAQGVAWAAARSVIGGYGNGRFGPNDNITREQLAVILWRYAGSPAAMDQALDFTDVNSVSDWALDALRWTVENGILSGKGGGILDPQGYATRAETAQILKNFMERQ